MDKLSLNRQPEESELAFIYRIAHLRGVIPGLDTWAQVGVWLNEVLGNTWSESAYRKKVQDFDMLLEELKGGFLEDDYIKMIDQKRELLFKQQVKTGDKLREYRAGLRTDARIEVLKSTVENSAARLEPLSIPRGLVLKGTGNEAVLLISDWHVGAKFTNFRNSYDVDIAKQRMGKLLAEVIDYCKMFKIDHLHVINLGDLVEGNIHVSVRVQSEIDVVDQTIEVSEMVAYFLLALEAEIDLIEYHHTLDNHGRINPNKKEHIEKENFGKIMHWWLGTRLKQAKSKIIFHQDEVDDNIGTFTLENGKEVAYVHGHLDKINTVFQNLGGLLRKSLDYVFMGHYHVAKMKEFQGGKVFVNGSLKGVDPFALDHRYMGRASQFLLVFDGNNEIPIVINVD